MTGRAFERFKENPDLSVLIIGGGVNGVGLLRELALQGVDCLLVEKSDFSSGTSAAGSRIVHGGFRYLENAEFRLVKESLQERTLLLKNAPHYVKPIAVTVPIRDWTAGVLPAVAHIVGLRAKQGNRGALLFKAGLAFYDRAAGAENPLPRHKFQTASTALALRPALRRDVVATATYQEARVLCPERLCLELVLDSRAACTAAQGLNYVSAHGAMDSCVVLRDETSGVTCKVRPRIVANASGPWIDGTNRALNRESCFIGGTKGSHVVLNHPRLRESLKGEMIYFINWDGRVCLSYPIGDKVLAGATDIPAEQPEETCTDAEVGYILSSIRQVFPEIHVDPSHVVFRLCGVRPLPKTKAPTPGQISRDHSCRFLPPAKGVEFPVYSMVGGKWTTFRAFAGQVTDEILPALGRKRMRDSQRVEIGGGKSYPVSPQEREAWLARHGERTGIQQAQLESLLEKYGTRAQEYADYIAEGRDAPLRNHPGYSRREIEFMALRESVVHLDDVILRRTLIGLTGESKRRLLEEIAGVLGGVLGWTPAEVAKEVERTAEILERWHGVTPRMLE